MSKKLIYLVSFVLVLSMAGKGWAGVSKPDPADGALHEDTWINLSWQPGGDAASFDVYISENFDNVSDGTGEAFRGNQTGDFFIVGIPGFPYPDGLVPGTTYYWRIDEVQTDGTTVHRGSIWSFMIPSETAKDPDPADGAEFVDLPSPPSCFCPEGEPALWLDLRFQALAEQPPTNRSPIHGFSLKTKILYRTNLVGYALSLNFVVVPDC